MLKTMLYRLAARIVPHSWLNRFAINRLVNAGRNRPHPWSTRHDDYIAWPGLTDRTWFARLLPASPAPSGSGVGTAQPPVADLVALFPAPLGRQVPCPKSTCLFPAFAQYLTDGFLRTRLFNTPPGAHTRPGIEDRRRTTSNHEIDLSALYGRTDEQTAALRTMAGGLMKSQSFGGEVFPPFLYGEDGLPKAEFCDASGTLVLDEPLGVKPGTPGRRTIFAAGGDRVNASMQVAAINTLFLREHNRVAGVLERGNPNWDDERIFQIARNILIVMFLRIVIHEYINHIAGAPFRFKADPAVCWNQDWNRTNWMTIEFTLLYRWHSLIPEEMTWDGAAVPSAALLLDNSLLLAGGLGHALEQLSGNTAARMGLGNFASFFAAGGADSAEGKGLQQGRASRVQGYNAYREAMGLSRAGSFEEVVGTSDDPTEQARRRSLADALGKLYGHVDNLEFYPGLFAEPCLEASPIGELVLAMVAMDAFSQALPNPLLSRHVWGDAENRIAAFSGLGLAEIERTDSLADLLARNGHPAQAAAVGMTRREWKPK